MVRLAIAAIIVVLFAYSALRSFWWWLDYRDSRSFRNFLNGLALLVGACAVGIVAYTLDFAPDQSERILEGGTWGLMTILLIVGLIDVVSWRFPIR